MLKLRPVVLDTEGFRQKKSGFIIKELSVCSHNYSDTISFLPPSSFNIHSSSEQKSYQWVSKFLHGLALESGDYPIAICSKLFKASNFVFRLPNFMQKELKRRTL